MKKHQQRTEQTTDQGAKKNKHETEQKEQHKNKQQTWTNNKSKIAHPTLSDQSEMATQLPLRNCYKENATKCVKTHKRELQQRDTEYPEIGPRNTLVFKHKHTLRTQQTQKPRTQTHYKYLRVQLTKTNKKNNKKNGNLQIANGQTTSRKRWQ